MSTTPRLLNLVEVGERLKMKKSNVRKFLDRHGIEPAFVKAQGYLWHESQIEEIAQKREADTEARASDEKRRQAALRRANGQAPERVGPTEAEVLRILLERPHLADRRYRHAARRLRLKGLIVPVEGEPSTFTLTERGAQVAGGLG